MSLPSRLLGANPSIQVSTLLSGSLTTPSAKGAFYDPPSFDSIASSAGGSTSITFSSIPQTYNHLQVRVMCKTTSAGDLEFRFNGDSGNNYTRHYFGSEGASSFSGGSISANIGYVGYNPSNVYFQLAILDILDYKSTNKYKTVRSFVGIDANGSGYVYQTGCMWLSTSAINQIVFTNNGNTYNSNSSFALYGIGS
jgi:hypothetical protein